MNDRLKNSDNGGSLFEMSVDEKKSLKEFIRKENLSSKKITTDDYLEFLQAYNEFINHDFKKIGKMKNFKWEL